MSLDTERLDREIEKDWTPPSIDDLRSLLVAARIASRAIKVGDLSGLSSHISADEIAAIKDVLADASDEFDTLAKVCAAGYAVIERAI